MFALPADYFDGTVNEPVLHQAVKIFLGNQRQGTAKTKGRSEVSGGNQKPWKQKGTGRARQGSIRAPHWRGGGIVFGPVPRDYRSDIPRKVKQLARRSALNARARESALHVVERLRFVAPKTSELTALLFALGIGGRKVLVLTAGHNRNAYLSGRNIPTVNVMSYSDASAYDILWAETVVVEEGAITGVVPAETDDPAAGTDAGTGKVARKSGSGRGVVGGTGVRARQAKTPRAPKQSRKAAKTGGDARRTESGRSPKGSASAKGSAAKKAAKKPAAKKAAKKSPPKGGKKEGK